MKVVKAISNYIAALITVAMIFTTISFFIITSTRQVQLSNYALNTMVQISDRAREDLAISSVIKHRRLYLTLVNTGTLDVTLEHLLIITKNLKLYKKVINGTVIPMNTIVNLEFNLPVPRDEIYSIKITTTRGNVFDVLSPKNKPLNLYIIPENRVITANERLNITIIVYNNIGSIIQLKPSDINISFIKYLETGSADVSDRFVLKNVYPDDIIDLKPGQQVVFVFTYEYGGGITASRIDLSILIDTHTIYGEEILVSSYTAYALTTQ